MFQDAGIPTHISSSEPRGQVYNCTFPIFAFLQPRPPTQQPPSGREVPLVSGRVFPPDSYRQNAPVRGPCLHLEARATVNHTRFSMKWNIRATQKPRCSHPDRRARFHVSASSERFPAQGRGRHRLLHVQQESPPLQGEFLLSIRDPRNKKN